MTFMKLNNLDTPIDVDSFDRAYPNAQDFQRSAGFSLEGVFYKQLREWSCQVQLQLTDYEAVARRDWMLGRGHYWTFERVDGATTRFNKYSSEGGLGWNTNITSSGTSKFGTWAAQVSSGNTSTVTASFGSENGYSVSTWRINKTGAYELSSAVYNGATTRFYSGASGTGVTTAFPWMTLSAASGYLGVGLLGKDEANASTTGFYDGVMILPYSLTTTMLSARATATVAEAQFPFVNLTGQCVEDLNPFAVKVMVESEAVIEVQGPGVVYDAKEMKLKIIERGR